MQGCPQTHLERSQSHPLYITLNFHGFDEEDGEDFIEGLGSPVPPEEIEDPDDPFILSALVNLILDQTHRIRHLALSFTDVESHDFERQFVFHFQGRLPNLTRLFVSRREGIPTNLLDVFSECQLLHRISLSRNCAQPERSQRFPYSRITELSVWDTTTGDAVTLLSKFSNLLTANIVLDRNEFTSGSGSGSTSSFLADGNSSC